MIAPYSFQNRVASFLRAGRSVILQAPTGAGKTRAAVQPFLDAFASASPAGFPRRCIYAVPMRVLANQFAEEYEPIMGDSVKVQTGERAEDRKFQGSLVFTTIDQVLSSFLAIPFSLSNSEANINSAAVFGSYLVFDEFHLYPQEPDGSGALGSTLEMLSWLKGITPFVLMTATFSGPMLNTLCTLLDAEKVDLSAEELAVLPSQQKSRRYETIDAELGADAVLAAHKKRSIAICNTVARAQALYMALRADPRSEGVAIKLLHARFLKEHRSKKEVWARREFSKDKSVYAEESAVLVATQVVEVGMDITCENLHTELAPANSILQRAGRCARYRGESGHVRIYKLPLDAQGTPSAMPYAKALCECTWKAFDTEERNGNELTYSDETAIVDEVHAEEDRKMLAFLESGRSRLRSDMEDALGIANRMEAKGHARRLIRNVDNITIIVHPMPGGDEPPLDPWAYEGFSIFRRSIQNRERIRSLLARAAELGLREAIWTPKEIEDKTENSRRPIRYAWHAVSSDKDLAGLPFLALHPTLVAYYEDVGFRFALQEDGTSHDFVSPPLERDDKKPGRYSYNAETYKRHIGYLRSVYKRDLVDEVAWVSRRLEQNMGMPAGLIDRAIRLALGCHDLGKMTVQWQKWAHDWQRDVGHPVRDELMLAHTFYLPDDPHHLSLNKDTRKLRPPHAVEGAVAASKLVLDALGDQQRLWRAVVTAVARHHNADSTRGIAYRLDRNASQTLQEVLDELARGSDWRANTALLKPGLETCLLIEDNGLVKPSDTMGQLLYFLIVRVLRLCDQEAVRLANRVTDRI